jgi:hypothetical protein
LPVSSSALSFALSTKPIRTSLVLLRQHLALRNRLGHPFITHLRKYEHQVPIDPPTKSPTSFVAVTSPN